MTQISKMFIHVYGTVTGCYIVHVLLHGLFLLAIIYSLKKIPFNFIIHEMLIVVDYYLVWTQLTSISIIIDYYNSGWITFYYYRPLSITVN